MQHLFICPQGHRWHTDLDAESDISGKVLRCPVCGQATETTSFQELSLGPASIVSARAKDSSETTAFQDLAAQQAELAAPQFSLAPQSTAFQDLNAQKEDLKSVFPNRPAETTAFQEIPVKLPDKESLTIATGAPPTGELDRSTSVTVRAPSLRREAPARPSPTLPGYEIIEEIGHTPTSAVYKARESSQQRLVAIKVITAGEYASPQLTVWLRAELKAVAELRHPCIVEIYEVGEHGGRIHVVMEYVDGGTLEQKIRGKPQPASAAAQMAETLARTVLYVHEQKLVHRNLKPSNILLTSDGMPKITDFAMARSADRSTTYNPEGLIGGSPSYMAPELLEGDQTAHSVQRSASPATDIYALGVILFDCLAGRPPFQGRSPADTAELVCDEDPLTLSGLQLSVPEPLETICMKCLERRPARRYASALDLAEDLRRFLIDTPIKAKARGLLGRTGNWSLRHPFAVASIILLVCSYLYPIIALLNQRTRLLDLLHTTTARSLTAESHIQEGRRTLYLADMSRAQEDWQQGDWENAVTFLEKHRKEEDLRSFDWGFLRRVCHADRLTLASAGRVRALAFSPDGQTLATVGEPANGKDPDPSGIRLWDAVSGAARSKFPATSVPVLAVVVAPLGRTLATADQKGKIQLWDALTGKQRHAFAGHVGPVNALAFTPDGKALASAGVDGVVKLWDPDTGKERATLPRHAGAVTAVAFSADGNLLAAGSQGDPESKAGEVRLWDWATRSQRAILQGHRGPVQCVAFAPDGKTLVSGGGVAGKAGELKLWDLGANRLKADLPGSFDLILAMAYAPDGRTLAVAGDDTAIKLWNMEKSPQLRSILPGHKARVLALAFAANSDTLASAGGDNTVKIWSVAQATGGITLRGYQHPIHGLAFARINRLTMLATVGGDSGRMGEVKVWDPGRAELLGEIAQGLDRSVLAVAASPDGKTLALAGEDTQVKLWRWDGKWKLTNTLKGHANWVTAVAISPQGHTIATGSADNTLRLWDISSGRELGSLPGDLSHVQALAFSPDGTLLAAADQGRDVRVWKVSTREVLLKLSGHTGSVLAVAFSPDGKLLATAGGDHTVRLWDVDAGQEHAVLRGHSYAVASVGFSPDGKCLVSGGRDGAVRLWDIVTGQVRCVLQGHSGWITSVAFSPDGKTLASASLDRTVKLWQAGE